MFIYIYISYEHNKKDELLNHARRISPTNNRRNIPFKQIKLTFTIH